MECRLASVLVAGLSLGLAGCATFTVEKGTRGQTPNGIRAYETRVCLFVDANEKKSTLAYLPDFDNAYDIKPLTILSKQDFKVEIEEGQVKALTSNEDTTAFLTFAKEAATLAAKAAGAGVSAQVLNGSFGYASGVYCIDSTGKFAKM